MISLLPIKLDDTQLERVRRNIHDAISEIQSLAIVGARVLLDVELKDGVTTPVAHGLGRAARWVRESCVRGGSAGGRIEEIRSSDFDRNKFVVLRATGFGATITVDLLVVP